MGKGTAEANTRVEGQARNVQGHATALWNGKNRGRGRANENVQVTCELWAWRRRRWWRTPEGRERVNGPAGWVKTARVPAARAVSKFPLRYIILTWSWMVSGAGEGVVVAASSTGVGVVHWLQVTGHFHVSNRLPQ